MRLSKKIENKQIHKGKGTLEEEMRSKNPWYIGDQIEAAQKHAKPTIQRRYSFINNNIETYLKSHKKKPLHVLDAGCGDGVQLQGLTENPELEVWGIDCNPIRTTRAMQRFRKVNIVLGDLLHTPFKPNTFDIILCSQVIEHISQDDVLLEELEKVLKPGGILILGTPNEGCLMARLRNHIFERNIIKSTDHLQLYKELIIRQKIEEAGFIIEEVMRENWFFPHQLINYYLVNRSWGFKLMNILSRIIPSQTAGYYFKCLKS
jgi:2-polyprenyl-3-methyl-5-hydroxy-6-metoxy-1,4-benzoquinol methylase